MTATSSSGRVLSYSKAVAEALAIEMERDPSVIVLGEDIGSYGGVFKATDGLHQRFGSDRVIDTPISEAGFVGIGVGAAIAGQRPVVELMFMDFALVAADQIWNQAAKFRYLSADQLRVPLTIRTQQGVGRGTAAQHSQCFEAIFAHIPGFAVALPASPADAKGLLATAIRTDDPVVVIEHKMLYGQTGEVPEGEYLVPLGKAATCRSGSDVTLVAYSRCVGVALEAADLLAADGVSAEVIDLRTVVPLDLDAVLESISKTGRLVVVHEGHRRCGIGAEITARVVESGWSHLAAPVQRVTGLDMPVPYAASLEAAWLPQPSDVVAAVKAVG